MKLFFLAYASAFVPMLILDALWLTVMSKKLYGPKLGPLLATNPVWGAAVLFYLLYLVGIVVFVLLPAVQQEWSLLHVFGMGALFGFIAYATYDLTNHATIKDWPILVTVVDLIWGAGLTGTVALVGRLILRSFVG